MRVSNSKVKVYQRCEKQYEFDYVHKIEPKAKNIYLQRGSWLHTLLEVHYAQDPKFVIEVDGKRYRCGTDWFKAHRILTKRFNNLFEEEREDLGDLPAECERIMRSYLARYEEEDKDEVTLATELNEWVTLPNGDEFNFIIDRVVERPGGAVWLKDYKTVTEFLPEDFMLIDAQLARYFWAFKKLPDFADLVPRLRGVEFDELRTKAPTVPELVNAKGNTKANPKPKVLTTRANLDTDYHTYLEAIKANGFKPSEYKEVLGRLKAQEERFFRRTILPKDKPVVRAMMLDLMIEAGKMKRAEKRGHFTRTALKSCRWDCSYIELCITDLHGGDIEPIVDLKFVPKAKFDRRKK